VRDHPRRPHRRSHDRPRPRRQLPDEQVLNFVNFLKGLTMLENIIDLGIIVYLGFKFFQTKKKHFLMLCLMMASLQLSMWPFFLPIQLTGAAIGATFSAFCFYDFHTKKDKHFLTYGFVLLYFAAINSAYLLFPKLKIFH